MPAAAESVQEAGVSLDRPPMQDQLEEGRPLAQPDGVRELKEEEPAAEQGLDELPSAIELEQSVGGSTVRVFKRLLDGPSTGYDNEILDVDIKEVDMEADREVDVKLHSDVNPLSAAHLATHLPKCAGCAGCLMAKSVKSRSQRRATPGVTVQAPDAESQPFGTMIHMDHIEMEHGTEAARARPATA